MKSGRSSLGRRMIPIALLITSTIIGIAFMAGVNTPLGESSVTGDQLSVDEASYYEYVEPRIEALLKEYDDVSALVEARSRNMLALSASATTIERLSTDILRFGDDQGVPERYLEVDALIESSWSDMSVAFDDARSALRTLNFDAMTTLEQTLTVARNDVASALERVRDVRSFSVSGDERIIHHEL